MSMKKIFAAGTAVKQHPDYQQELLQIIRSNHSPYALKEAVLAYHESDIASVLAVLGTMSV